MKIYFSLIILLLAFTASGQHDHHTPPPKTKAVKKASPPPAPKKKPAAAKPKPVKKAASPAPAVLPVADSLPEADPGHMHHMDTTHGATPSTAPAHDAHNPDTNHTSHASHEGQTMSHAYSINLPMNRNGSGTSWLPDNSPVYGYMKHKGAWMLMGHGNFFLRYNNQDITNQGTRGSSQVDMPGWFMLMGQRQKNKGLLHFSAMFSVDVLTMGGRGYPLLFQSGETFQGEPLVDRQHPHDFISELSVSYSHALNSRTDAFIYLGYPGEPALGPVAFMHRPSALANPDAPLSHHWVDATHITFGVLTGGLRFGNFKLEASSFTGREPDENRFDFDQPRFDSWSGRLSFSPGRSWTFQVSTGLLHNPEVIHPRDVRRSTASAGYSTETADNEYLNASFVWGLNKSEGHAPENAWLLEGTWTTGRLSLHWRYENVQKSAEELHLHQQEESEIFVVQQYTLGMGYDLMEFRKTRLALGSHLTVFNSPDELQHLYGERPVAMQLYLRLYPALLKN